MDDDDVKVAIMALDEAFECRLRSAEEVGMRDNLRYVALFRRIPRRIGESSLIL